MRLTRRADVNASSFGFTIAGGDNGAILVSRVDAETPACTSGLRVGDHVIRVNGYDVTAASLVDVASLVRSASPHQSAPVPSNVFTMYYDNLLGN